jgi:hypothetical protein
MEISNVVLIITGSWRQLEDDMDVVAQHLSIRVASAPVCLLLSLQLGRGTYLFTLFVTYLNLDISYNQLILSIKAMILPFIH